MEWKSAEFFAYFGGEKADAFEEYLTYGGMPLAVLEKDEAEKRSYLNGLHKRVYRHCKIGLKQD